MTRTMEFVSMESNYPIARHNEGNGGRNVPFQMQAGLTKVKETDDCLSGRSWHFRLRRFSGYRNGPDLWFRRMNFVQHLADVGGKDELSRPLLFQRYFRRHGSRREIGRASC